MNVIFILNDSFRRDHLGCYGNSWIKTPNLDQFAQRAALFEHYYTASYPTVPNRWDLVTGRFGFPFRGWQPLAPNDVTWAEIISKQGVQTQLIWDTPMLGMHDYNFTRGFDGLSFVRGQKGDPWITDPSLPIQLLAQPHKIRGLASHESYLRNHFNRQYERQFCVGRTISEAMDWLETNHNHEPFFLCVDMWDPHEPFDCPWYDYGLYAEPNYQGDKLIYPEYGRVTYLSEEERKSVRALYAGNVTLVDRWLGYLFNLVERLGLFKDTLIIWATDHGHLFGEHNLQGKPGAELGTLYEVTTHIPLLVYHPEGLGANKRIKGVVQPPDILPSILDFLDIPIPPQVQGQSFWPLLTGEGSVQNHAFTSRFPPTAAEAEYQPGEASIFDGWVGSDRLVEPATITNDEWAYLCAPEGRPSELYNLKKDPSQEHNVIDDHPEMAQSLRKLWIEFLESHDAPEVRIRPFKETSGTLRTPHGGKLYAFQDDQSQWIAFPTEQEAQLRAFQKNAPGPMRTIKEVTFGELLEANPRNLVHLFGQYYWAEDLA